MADTQGIAGDQLRNLIEKVERLEEEKREVAEQIKEVMAEAKGEGFDVKVIRKLLSLRRMKPHDRVEQDELLELYKSAIGMM
ncbi:Uncharacterized conserved protein, UPF0335 family [Arboricoccus pini]|uniref:UPF0335 protein SAMN07250955_10790 n=1 Tax=Arboricoccus pini TaxID=1963835 RepID=A0A212RD25_9PROT|nr:DUF2312 domain-containing protein [Arboricoccus pini]SNB69991.1 Uncharacterized conserved protein, UPF0335 family [Arboricoccus pini]